jgi:type II secretory pathway component GspD/PulD (secretin)
MTRRKAILVFAVTLLLTVGGGFFWIQQKPSHDFEVKEMRGCLQPRPDAPLDFEPSDDPDLQIQLHITVIALNRDELGQPLLEASDGRAVQGRVKNLDRLLSTGQSVRSMDILSQPRLMTMNGQPFAMNVGHMIPLPTENGNINMKQVGLAVTGTPKIGKDGRIRMPFSLTLTESKVTPPTAEADFDVMELKANLEITNGETNFVGGVTRRAQQTQQIAIPLLSELPAIGSWFQFSRHVEFEQELLVTVSAKIVHTKVTPAEANVETSNIVLPPRVSSPPILVAPQNFGR